MENKRNPAAAASLSITNNTLISWHPSVITAEVDGEIMMMSLTQDRYFSFNDIGRDIWRHLDVPLSFAELTHRVAADYDADRTIIEDDISAFLRRMVVEDVVRLG